MDGFLISCVVSILCVVSLIQLLSRNHRRLPPGPWSLPVIGAAHHLAGALPHRALRDLAAVHGPLMHLRLGEADVVVVSSQETARDVLRTHDANFATRPRLLVGEIVAYRWADILFSPSGEYWAKLRKLCVQEIMSPKRITSFRHIREEEVFNRVQEMHTLGPSMLVDLTSMFHDITTGIISRTIFGKKSSKIDKMHAAVKRGLTLSSGFNLPDLFPTLRPVLSRLTGMRQKLEEVHREVDNVFEDAIRGGRERRAGKSRGDHGREANLVDVLLDLQEEDNFGFPITDNTIKAVILDMIAAGTVSSGSALEWTISLLMNNPETMKKLQAEIRQAFHGNQTITQSDLHNANLTYLRLVIKESLRLHPPAPLLVPHESVEPCEIAGCVVPARSRVVVNAWAIGRDPRYWEDSEEFMPERFEGVSTDFLGNSYEFIPFGSGKRICPGINFAVASIEMALVQFLYWFNWALPDGVEQLDMTEAPGLGARRRTPLLLYASPYACT